MVEPVPGAQDTRWRAEILRRASVVLDGHMVGMWEVAADASLVPVPTGATNVVAQQVTPEVAVALRRLRMPAPPGSRWVAGRAPNGDGWCVAPIRSRLPDPPPLAQERRRRERLALELAGLCLGLSEELAGHAGPTNERDLLQRFTEQLAALARELGHPLDTARTGLAEMNAVLQGSPPEQALRDQLLQHLRRADQALQQAAALVRSVRDRAGALLEGSGDFDVAQVVWSAVSAERARAAEHGVTIEFATLAFVIAITGAASDFHRAVVFLLRGAVTTLRGRPGTVHVAVDDLGPVARLTVRATVAASPEPTGAPADIGATWVLEEARKIVETLFGGSLAVTATSGEGAVVTVMLAVKPGRFPRPGRAGMA